jgi:hypothetical protein
MSDPITITNPGTGEKWTSGSRGKPPKWVSTHASYIAFKGLKATEAPVAPKVATVSDVMLKFWKLVGLEDCRCLCNCYVAAFSVNEALRLLAQTFKNPVTPRELTNMWKEIEPTEFMVQAVGVYELKDKTWQKR